MTYYSFFMGEKKDKENMVKKKDTDIRFWGLSFAIFLISSIFFVVVCMGHPKSMLIIRLKKKCLNSVGLCV